MALISTMLKWYFLLVVVGVTAFVISAAVALWLASKQPDHWE